MFPWHQSTLCLFKFWHPEPSFGRTSSSGISDLTAVSRFAKELRERRRK